MIVRACGWPGVIGRAQRDKVRTGRRGRRYCCCCCCCRTCSLADELELSIVGAGAGAEMGVYRAGVCLGAGANETPTYDNAISSDAVGQSGEKRRSGKW